MALNDENSGIPATMLVGPTGYAGNNGGVPVAQWAEVCYFLQDKELC